jgi:CRISPR/Cas system-associated exonuclease Cas4 (RecB family)
MGNLLHDLFERSLYAHADRAKGRSEALTQIVLNEQLQNRFSQGWAKSRELTIEVFKRNLAELPREERPVWLVPHALPKVMGRIIDLDDDALMREARRGWMASAAEVINNHLLDLIEFTPPSAWVFLEGKELLDGDVVSDGTRAQQELRAEAARPSIWIKIDGRPIEIFCTIDFAYEREGVLVLADLKTGREKADQHRRQLELYGVFAVASRGTDPNRIVVRLMYPQDPDGKWIREYEFNEGRLKEAEKRLEDDARRILNCYVPLSHKEVDLEQLSLTFSPHDAEHLAAIGAFKRTGAWPNASEPAKVVKFLIETLSPPEMARAFDERYPGSSSLLEVSIERARAGGGRLSYERVNRELLARIMPTQILSEFLSAFSVEHLVIPLATRFVENEATKWVEREEVRRREGGRPEGPNCQSCQFSWFCEPGMQALAQY